MNVFVRERPIIEQFKRWVEERFPGELIRLVLFGSKARGEATADSDLDVLAIVRSEDWRLGDEIRDIGYELEVAHGVVLSIQVMGERHYQELKARGSTFLANVEREGLAV
ncbi:MAG: nucleotidyltransferase domain-containing protein [Nitrospira sp.]|nr:nucleotidyltransferase domain-containing protein [Nitrospira sp.]